MTLPDFADSYLAMQGVEIRGPIRKPETRAITCRREGEYVPTVPMYERGD